MKSDICIKKRKRKKQHILESVGSCGLLFWVFLHSYLRCAHPCQTKREKERENRYIKINRANKGIIKVIKERKRWSTGEAQVKCSLALVAPKSHAKSCDSVPCNTPPTQPSYCLDMRTHFWHPQYLSAVILNCYLFFCFMFCIIVESFQIARVLIWVVQVCH